MDNDISELVSVIGATGLGGLLIAFFIRFALRKFSEENVVSMRADGEVTIIEQLRKEVDRLAEINEKLSNRIFDLQTQVINLRRENSELTDRIRILSAQIEEMRGVS